MWIKNTTPAEGEAMRRELNSATWPFPLDSAPGGAPLALVPPAVLTRLELAHQATDSPELHWDMADCYALLRATYAEADRFLFAFDIGTQADRSLLERALAANAIALTGPEAVFAAAPAIMISWEPEAAYWPPVYLKAWHDLEAARQEEGEAP